MMPDLHIDLETLDTVETSKILEIGAVCGSDEFHCAIDTESYAKFGNVFTESGDTLVWHVANTRHVNEAPEPVIGALIQFIIWCNEQEYTEVWANAPSFDCSMLRYHFRQFNFTCPWPFYNERDVRTARKLVPNISFAKNAHNALSDARNQRDGVDKIKDYLTTAGRVK